MSLKDKEQKITQNIYSVSVENLTKRFGRFTAVNNISFKVRQGEIFGFLGPNGAGKSTTIRILCGIQKPTSGQARIGSFDVGTQSEDIKRIIGYMSQKFTLYPDLTVEENISFYGGIHLLSRESLITRRKPVLKLSGLTGKEQTKARDLSGGWKQRLSLACAILHEPQILFLDEPTASVDPSARRDFWDLIYLLSAKGTTVFVTSHYMDEVERAHRLAILFEGRIITIGSPAELKKRHTGSMDASLEDVFITAVEEQRSLPSQQEGAP